MNSQSLVEWTFSEGTEISYVSTQFVTILHFGKFFASSYEFTFILFLKISLHPTDG